ncbi:MAG: hypothetical protein K2L28_02635 [Muribaculaceae bacterium]|nr:hypothetical protein [Muribaculaceae bacterium]
MKNLISTILVMLFCVTASAKPRCQGFNNHDNKVTIVFSDDNAGLRYTVSDVKLIPEWKGTEYRATSVETAVKDGVATVTLVFPHITQFSNPRVSLSINGEKRTFKVCQ